jgi:hypothetical protein
MCVDDIRLKGTDKTCEPYFSGGDPKLMTNLLPLERDNLDTNTCIPETVS